jgi:hypothetical protein
VRRGGGHVVGARSGGHEGGGAPVLTILLTLVGAVMRGKKKGGVHTFRAPPRVPQLRGGVGGGANPCTCGKGGGHPWGRAEVGVA